MKSASVAVPVNMLVPPRPTRPSMWTVIRYTWSRKNPEWKKLKTPWKQPVAISLSEKRLLDLSKKPVEPDLAEKFLFLVQGEPDVFGFSDNVIFRDKTPETGIG